jgi:AcrR family transcriptional regulator
MRADARRNAELIVATAREVFGQKGADAPLDEIAKRAGVGAGTLYRHFPSREVLVEAVYRDEVGELADRVEVLLAEYEPFDALARWMREQMRFVDHRRGLAANLKFAVRPGTETMNWCRDRLLAAAAVLIDACRAVGAVRADLEPFDLMRFGHGLAVVAEFGDEADTDRMLDIVLAGLRQVN